MLDADAVVIGSGMGGLTAALTLARAGQKVLVLEQHYLPGGYCHSFHLEGFRYSPGVHYVGDLHEGGFLRRMLEGLGVSENLTFFQLNPDGFEHCLLAGERFDYPSGRAALQTRLAARFPREAAGIGSYLDLVEKVREQLYALTDLRKLVDLLRLPFSAPAVTFHGLSPLAKVLNRRVKDPLARAILAVQCGDHGLPPSLVPFAVHASVTGHYFHGGWYPRGGGAGLVRAFTRALERHGGKVLLDTRVERILLEGEGEHRRAVGVRLTDGRELRAARVISNADPAVTFQRLVGEEHLSAKLRRRLAATRWSISSLSLFFAVDVDVRKLGMDSGNYWYGPTTDAEATYRGMIDPRSLDGDGPLPLFLTASTLKDPTHYDGRHHVLEAFTFVSYDAFARWASSRFGERPEDYERLKARLAARMLRTVDQLVPGLSRHVVFQSLGTPLTNQHYVEATRGSVYGTEKSRSQVGPGAYQTRTEIRGLSLCGASTLGHGVTGAMLSGLTTAAGLLKLTMREVLAPSGAAPVATYLAEDPSGWPVELKESIARRRRHPEPQAASSDAR